MSNNTQNNSGTLSKIGETVALTPGRWPLPTFCHVQIQATVGGSTVIIETSPDGSNWLPVNARIPARETGTARAGAITLNGTSRELYVVPLLFGQSVRVRLTGISSGSVSVVLDAPLVRPGWIIGGMLGIPAGSFRCPLPITEPAIPGLPGVTAY